MLPDLAAFGQPFISAPDIVERLRQGWPLAGPGHMHAGIIAGYADDPAFAPDAR
jgi:2,4-dienoyl-CoA reductase-like NADH-dependent reductase (Old Yellow Enzyme family)